ncbi:MAG TPA: phenylalanine--tRNA ligase subunit beta [Micromonosporaceae bacterium]|nr:phenylalanine--tRNA ligase subunit beta [Micromonosporaceae bacterium]
MRVPVSWLREYVDAPTDPSTLEKALVRVGLEVEEMYDAGASVTGPLVIGRVRQITELTEFKKPIRHCLVDIGSASTTGEPQSIVCGATNFVEGDLVVVVLPGAVLPGGFAISERKTYGHISAGMICSARELGLGDDHTGIMVLPPDTQAALGDDARPVIGMDELVVELAITPDRGYCFSVRGVAREVSHSLALPYADPAAGITPVVGNDRGYPVRVEAAHASRHPDQPDCDRFVAVTVRGVDPHAASPAWMKQRLVHAGMRPISLIVDITNYLMIELGQPMHAFDLARLSGPLVVRRAVTGESLSTLDGTTRVLDADDIVITDDTGVISLAAVMGGASTEVTDDTADVLFEAAHWAPLSIAHTARRHKLPSEASKRFERGVDPALAPVAAARAAQLLVEYGGGTIDVGVTDVDTVAPRADIRMAVDHPSRIAGVDYPPAQVVAFLRDLGCVVVEEGAGLVVTPPTWRPDLTEPIELVEEVIRLAGYEDVPSVLPPALPGHGRTPEQRRRRTVGRALAEAGYTEVLCYPFVSPGVFDALGLAEDDPRRVAVRLANPLSADEPLLRTTMIPPLLATLRRNIGRGQRDLALFEMGLVFQPSPGQAGPSLMGVAHRPSDEELAATDAALPDQPWTVAVVLAGDVQPAGWWGAGRAATWADAVEAARVTVAAAGQTATVRAGARAPWHPGRCAEILAGDAVVGYAGELHPSVCAALEVPRRTCAMELTLDAVPLPGVTGARPLSNYPPALIDVALVVDTATPAAEVESALVDGAGPLLESVRLFDVYASDALGAGRKSLAYSLTFRAPDRTLTVEEAVAARDAAVAVAAQRHGATLRS